MNPVLIVDDEKAIADLIEMTLEPFGYACRKAYSGEEAADLIGKEHFDLILLDVMLPGVDGFTLMDYIAPTGTPVIFLTAKTAVEDRVRGLRAGAYDYIVKPFAAEELLARVDGLMRHTGRRKQTIHIWGVDIQPESRTVTRDGTEIRLKPKEYDLLMALVYNRGIALYRDVLLERVWGLDCDVDPRTLDIHISRLRKKLGWTSQLRAVPKIGYLLEVEP
ncbi:MAG: response regulator transcription factor [Blautia massiliensis (ex Durand et al. 2017)]|nr:MAG: DNA-binding response regulator [Subdoligranulum variabile]